MGVGGGAAIVLDFPPESGRADDDGGGSSGLAAFMAPASCSVEVIKAVITAARAHGRLAAITEVASRGAVGGVGGRGGGIRTQVKTRGPHKPGKIPQMSQFKGRLSQRIQFLFISMITMITMITLITVSRKMFRLNKELHIH